MAGAASAAACVEWKPPDAHLIGLVAAASVGALVGLQDAAVATAGRLRASTSCSAQKATTAAAATACYSKRALPGLAGCHHRLPDWPAKSRQSLRRPPALQHSTRVTDQPRPPRSRLASCHVSPGSAGCPRRLPGWPAKWTRRRWPPAGEAEKGLVRTERPSAMQVHVDASLTWFS